MPDYVFQQKIRTVAQTRDPFGHNGNIFQAFRMDWRSGKNNGWMVSKELTADNVDAAFEAFFSELYPLVDKLSFITQCYMLIEIEPFLVRRTDRQEFFFRHSRERKPVPLHFGGNELESLRALERYGERGNAFQLLREAINTSGFYTRLAMLASALEGIAGEERPGKTDRNYIETKILGDKKLSDKIFKYAEGIRNQILHGKRIDDDVHGDTPYPHIIYERIVEYFNANHGTKINTEVVGAPRTVGGNYSVWHGWLRPVDNAEIDFVRMCESVFPEATRGFEPIERPEDY